MKFFDCVCLLWFNQVIELGSNKGKSYHKENNMKIANYTKEVSDISWQIYVAFLVENLIENKSMQMNITPPVSLDANWDLKVCNHNRSSHGTWLISRWMSGVEGASRSYWKGGSGSIWRPKLIHHLHVRAYTNTIGCH